jgi:SAM-dependent methyltransferase
MDSYEETFHTWNKVALLYQEKFMDLNLYDKTYDFFCDALTSHHTKLLEVGCGPGNITKYLLLKRPDFKIDAIDVAPNMITLAKQNNPTVNFWVMDIRNMDSLIEKYDAIVNGFCLPYLSESDAEKFISDSATSLKDKGLLYLSFVEGNTDNSGYQVGNSGDRTYFYYHTLEYLENIFLKNGFERIFFERIAYKKLDGSSELHSVIILKKKRA